MGRLSTARGQVMIREWSGYCQVGWLRAEGLPCLLMVVSKLTGCLIPCDLTPRPDPIEYITCMDIVQAIRYTVHTAFNA